MGGSLSCLEEQVPPHQRFEYDMSPIKEKNLPIIWLVGPPGSGRHTHAKLLAENLEFEDIKVADLIRQESEKATTRGTIIDDIIQSGYKRVPAGIIIDLIKEEMLKRSSKAKGFIINNFPRSSKQSELFIKEISDVDAIIYLTSETPVMVKRSKDKNEGRLNDEAIKKAINSYMKEVREGTVKLANKVEKVRTMESVTDVYDRIETAINVRISKKTRITAESDYAQSQSEGKAELIQPYPDAS